MKTTGLLFIILTIVVTQSFAQNQDVKHYCQGCCSGVGEYYLRLDSENEFELHYLVGNPLQKKSVFGIGTYSIKDEILILTFENISKAGFELKKINDNESLVIHFYCLDNVRCDSVALLNVGLSNGTSFFYASASGTIRSKFDHPETVNFSSLGFNDITCSLTEPGEYELIVRLNPESKTLLKQGHQKKFRIIKTYKEERLVGIDDQSLNFTTDSCR